MCLLLCFSYDAECCQFVCPSVAQGFDFLIAQTELLRPLQLMDKVMPTAHAEGRSPGDSIFLVLSDLTHLK